MFNTTMVLRQSYLGGKYRGYKLSATYSNTLSLAIDNAFHDSKKVVTTLLIALYSDWLHKTRLFLPTQPRSFFSSPCHTSPPSYPYYPLCLLPYSLIRSTARAVLVVDLESLGGITTQTTTPGWWGRLISYGETSRGRVERNSTRMWCAGSGLVPRLFLCVRKDSLGMGLGSRYMGYFNLYNS